jgi:hypothetical protein
MIAALRPRVLAAVLAAVALAAAVAAYRWWREDESEEEEEREQTLDHYWRPQIVITGAGRVRSVVPGFDCTSDGTSTHGACGPALVRFKELAPPSLEAVPAPGWRLDRWESSTREADGSVHGRTGPRPDGRLYINGFGYADTGAVETVTAVFAPLDAGAP